MPGLMTPEECVQFVRAAPILLTPRKGPACRWPWPSQVVRSIRARGTIHYCATARLVWDLTGRRIYTTAKGYQMVYLPEHPHATSGTIFLHRVVMENHLGRLLQPGVEMVHHDDDDKGNNEIGNLKLMSRAEHARHHARQRPVLGETMIPCICDQCGVRFEREKRNVHRSPHRFCSRSCAGKHSQGRVHSQKRPTSHGTYGRYRKGCRCPSCVAANTAKMKRYRAKNKETPC